ncbi:MAG TPA: hypothetical protein VGG40_10855 [Solirubrobacterales bacterium]
MRRPPSEGAGQSPPNETCWRGIDPGLGGGLPGARIQRPPGVRCGEHLPDLARR